MLVLNESQNFALTNKTFLISMMADKDISFSEKELLVKECLLSDKDKAELSKVALKNIGVE